jgi:uncharacterized protein YceK
MKTRFAVVIVVLTLLAGCASIISGRRESVSFQSVPTGVTVAVNAAYSGRLRSQSD